MSHSDVSHSSDSPQPNSADSSTSDAVHGIIYPSPSISERILWSPPYKQLPCAVGRSEPEPSAVAGSQTVSPHSYSFSCEMIAEIQAAASYAFGSDQSKEAHIETNRSITLYCPHEAGHTVIDSVVKLVADRQNADVLVLDALELSLGELGALGKGARAIDVIYEAIPKSEGIAGFTVKLDGSKGFTVETNERNSDNAQIGRWFEALVDVSPRPNANTEQPTRRIIYLRDFGSIAKASKPLMAYILQALVACRQRQYNDGVQKKPRSMLLVMGVAATIGQGMGSHTDAVSFSDIFSSSRRVLSAEQRQEVLRAGNYALNEIIPHLDSKVPQSKKTASPVLCNGLSAQMFLPLTVDPSILKYLDLSMPDTLGRKLDDFASYSVVITVFTKDASRRQQEADRLERIADVNDALLRLSLGRRGGRVSENTSFMTMVMGGGDPSLQDKLQSSVISPSAADTIATIAIGLSSPGCSHCYPIPVTPTTVAEAYRLTIKNASERASWVDQKEKKSEDQAVDPIVKRVKELSNLSTREKQFLECLVDPLSLSTSFEDVCIDPKVVEMLRRVVCLRILYPQYFTEGILAEQAINGVLLYGPPGTGKTMLCRALARECGARMLMLKASDVHDKYIGEGEKNAQSIFALACRLAPCVVFIDEMDALFGSRTSQTISPWRTDILTEFMQAIDGLKSASANQKKGVVVVGASNRPFDIDAAMLRRFPCRVMVDLPGERERKRILELHLKGEALDDDVNLAEIASDSFTESYSGSDLKNLCVSAAMASVTDAIGSDLKWNKSRTIKNSETYEHEDGLRKASSGQTPTSKPSTLHTIAMKHFEHALKEVGPSFSEAANAELYKWHGMTAIPEKATGKTKNAYEKELRADEVGAAPDVGSLLLQVLSLLNRAHGGRSM